ncbi:MAG: AraC family transcriptional regulator [Nitrospiraceae bacterium]|nr:AraC family transcriptional regulator [Nitrospiraceae bacterium]
MDQRPSEKQHVEVSSEYQSEVFCKTHMQIPVGDMVFHVFGVASNAKYPGWQFRNDRHGHHELIYTISGQGHYEIRGKSVQSGAGDFFFTPRNVVHHGEIDSGVELWKSLVVELDFSFARDPEVYLDDLGVFPMVLPFYRHFIVEERVSLTTSPELRPAIELIVERLSLEVAQHPFDYDLVLQSQMLEFLSLVCRAAREDLSRVPLRQYANRVKGLLRLEKARRFVGEHYQRSLSVKEIADEACMSQYHFVRLFKKAFGMTPIQYQGHLRISEAKKMLVSTDAQVSEIGYRLGYSSPEYFSRQFTAKVGVSPSHYTQNLAERFEEGSQVRRSRAE